MASLVDAVIFIPASGGTGDFVVSTAKPGWRTPAQASAVNGATYRYRAYSADQTEWEIGTGIYTVGTLTLTRAVILDSSNAGAAVNFGVAPSVALTILAQDFATPAQLAKVDWLTVTQAVNLDSMETQLAALGTASTKNTGVAAGNVPVLDGSGLLDTSILPAIAIIDVSVVASQAAMLALTAQKGDVAVRSDLNKSFMLSTNSPGTLADWKELLTPTDAVLSVAGLTGAISAAGLKTALAIAQADVSGLTTADSPQLTGINLGHASDTTLTRSSAGVMAVEGVTVPLNSITNTHTALGIEVGHATDSTLTRASAGDLAVEGNRLFRVGGADVPVADGGTGSSTAPTARTALSASALVAAFTPLQNQPPAANYATLDTRNSIAVLDFDDTTQEAAIFSGSIPANYNGGGLTVTVWSMMTTATSGTVGWDGAFESQKATDQDADSFATAKTFTAATVSGTSGIMISQVVAFSNSEIDGLAAGDPFRFRLRLDTAGTATGDAELVRVVIEMT